MGNFEKLSVLVIVVIIVMILVVALYTWTDNPDQASGGTNTVAVATETREQPPVGESGMTGGAGLVIQSPPSGVKDKSAAGLEPRTVDQLVRDAMGGGAKPVELPPVPPPTPPPAAPRTYTIKAGDSLSTIASREYPKSARQGLAAIQQANPTLVPERLRPGTPIVLPELGAESSSQSPTPMAVPPRNPSTSIAKGGVYVVKKGDTLVSISKRAYGTADKWQDIWLTNFDVIDDVDHPLPGTRLKISQ